MGFLSCLSDFQSLSAGALGSFLSGGGEGEDEEEEEEEELEEEELEEEEEELRG